MICAAIAAVERSEDVLEFLRICGLDNRGTSYLCSPSLVHDCRAHAVRALDAQAARLLRKRAPPPRGSGSCTIATLASTASIITGRSWRSSWVQYLSNLRQAAANVGRRAV